MESWRGVPVPELPGTGPEPRIRDTATGELLVAADGQVATMYACGITPYDSTHIGHAATFTAWDLLLRAWLDAGHEVIYVQNVTDVDDPLLERAARDGADWRQLAGREIDRYRADMHALRVLPPSRLVGAVEAMSLIERFTARLADCGALYELDADLYFPRSADPLFGSLSRLSPRVMVKLFAERGGDPGRPGKKDPLDALVWLAARPGEPSWASPFGDGRPGWHVECAAISTEYLGPVFDMQVGGTDLIFPHHEMSASHARAAFGGGGAPAFARRYAHAGMVGLDGEKMSKSLGNLVFVSDLVADGTEPAAIRLALLAHHYRDDWDWSAAGLAAAEERLARWRSAVAAADRGTAGVDPAAAGADRGAAAADRGTSDDDRGAAGADGGAAGADGGAAGAADPSDSPARQALASVRDRLADDLDAPGALAAVDQWAEAVLAGSATGGGRLIRDAVDALLGVEL
jgi:L-cysteine:1D-myo-inositol 2-amino-2-deoxy-alpha-D-glucopyranoside ligase